MRRLILLIGLSMFLFCSCGAKDDFYNANKKISEMKSYTAEVETIIYNNKGASTYRVKQYFTDPDKLRIETMEPDFLKGKVVCYDGTKWKIYHPLIKQTFELGSLKDDDELIYMGVLQKNILIGEDVNYRSVSKDNIEYIQLKSTMPNGNEYRKYAVVYLSKKDYLPKMMEIYDSKDNLKVQAKYTGFKYNTSIKEDIFNLK